MATFLYQVEPSPIDDKVAMCNQLEGPGNRNRILEEIKA